MSWNDRASGAPESLAGMVERIGSAHMLLDAGLALLLLGGALLAPQLGSRLAERIEAGSAWFTARPWRAILAVGALAVVARALFLPWMGAPVPVIHDEQSLLLQAQTHLLGRLANPPHPFWQHFETFHVNVLPAYASMYFPGRSAPHLVGLLLGDAWLGIWLSVVALAMASVWMLQAWVPAGYALLGGVLVVLRFGIFSYWVNSYWGGAFTALGAMLVIGALPRLLARPSWSLGVVLGLGAAILATTRAYEGFLLCVPVALVLLWRLARPARWAPQPLARGPLLRATAPAALLVAGAAALLLAHNTATTGHALKTPYGLNRATYAVAPAFLVSPPVQSQQRGPAYFREFYTAEGSDYVQRRKSPVRLAGGLAGKVFHNWNFYVGPALSFSLLAGLWAVRRERFLVGSLLLFAAGYAILTWNFPHYAAPVMPLVLIVLMRGFMQLRDLRWRGRPGGLWLTRAMPAAAAALLLLPAASVVLGVPRLKPNNTNQACCTVPYPDLRSSVIAHLQAQPGRDLVLVRDGPQNPLHYEMVYNEPVPENADVVIARRIDPARDAALVRHFAGRQVWEFEWRPDLPDKHTLKPVDTRAAVTALQQP